MTIRSIQITSSKLFYKIILQMPDFNDFNPALPIPIKWSIGPNRFNQEEEQLSFTIPVESITHLIDHLQNLVNTKTQEGVVYDPRKKDQNKGKVKAKVVYLNSKVMTGEYGTFGLINPQKIENAPNTQGLF